QLLAHLGITAPGPRLALVIRSWITLAETTALAWLEGRAIPRRELERQLVHDLLALAAVTAVFDEQTAEVVRRVLEQEPADGPFGELVGRLPGLLSGGAGGTGESGGTGAGAGSTADGTAGRAVGGTADGAR
ncbi:MAG TPA: TetR family transcriptional regulator, partial [Streptomyces sp.]|nr:TetR family transcriptional regulator [Streptomyces sp.]